MSDTPEKRPVGRPSKYKQEYCQQMLEFFSVEPTQRRFDSDTSDEKTSKETYKQKGVDFPTFVRFGVKIGVCHDTLIEWCSVHPEFSVAYATCKELQEDVWKVNSLNGNYNSAFAIFLGKNVYGYKDKSEVEQNHTVTQMPTIKLDDGSDLVFNVGEPVDE